MRIGVYIRGIKKSRNNPYEIADHLTTHGISFAVFMVIWQEATTKNSRFVNTKVLAEWSKIFHEAGIETWIWGYPWCGHEDVFVKRLEWAKKECSGRLRGIILDPELGYQGHKVGRSEAKFGATTLINGVLDTMDESTLLGVTSFGAGHVHGTFPWSEFCAGFGSPQFYKTTNLTQISKGLAHWVRSGWSEIYPSVPAFGQNSGTKLRDYINLIEDCAKNSGIKMTIPGYIVWSLKQLDGGEWDILKELADRKTLILSGY